MLQEPPYDTPSGNAVQPVLPMVLDPASGKAQPADTATPANPVNGAIHNAAVVVALDNYALNGTIGYSATSATTLWQVSTAGYESLVVQITSAGSATTVIEGSHDGGTTWTTIIGQNLGALANAVASAAAVGLYQYPCCAPLMRQRVSVYTSGTVNVIPVLRDAPMEPVINITSVGSITQIGQISAAVASNSTTLVRVKAAATTNATSVKTTAGNLYGGILSNTTASNLFVKFYNKASAPTVGTDTPYFTTMVPANGVIELNLVADIGVRFATGIAYAITGAVADSDTTAVTADAIHGCLVYA
jgi:hypothetical protein